MRSDRTLLKFKSILLIKRRMDNTTAKMLAIGGCVLASVIGFYLFYRKSSNNTPTP